jgi:hypothetical protein
MCGTIDELHSVWDNMDETQQIKLKKYVNEKKKEMIKNEK